MPPKKNRSKDDFVTRIDLKTVESSFDEKTNILSQTSIPDPERYEHMELDGEKGYFDKYSNIFFPEDEFKKAINDMKDTPVYYSPSKIRNTSKYIHSRIGNINDYLNGHIDDEPVEKDSTEFLDEYKEVEMDFVIISIDIIGSTKMSQYLSPEVNIKLIKLFLREMTLIVAGFNGFVLKYTGDGLIAFFPEPSIASKHDHAIDGACTMRRMVISGINPILKNKDLPELDIRIGLDSGKGIISELGIEGIKTQIDILGETVNLANKIQKIASKNKILIGDSTARNVHIQWRKRMKEFELPEGWNYEDKFRKGHPYPVYYLDEC